MNCKIWKNTGVNVVIIGIIVIGSISIQESFAISPIWPGSFSLNEGGVTGAGIPTFPVTVSVTDGASSGAGSVKVRITSSLDPVGFDLTLNEGPPGTFTNTNLALMPDDYLVTVPSSLTIIIFDDSDDDPLSTQTLPPPTVRVVSDSDTTGIIPTFNETGPDTNLFSATINFDSSTNVDTDTLAASPGDIFSIWDSGSGNIVSGFVGPNPNLGKGAIIAEVDGTVTATYQGDSSSFIVGKNPGSGRGTGGLVKPVIVFDSDNGSDDDSKGGGCSNCQPPTLGLDSKNNRIVQNGFSFNGNPIDVEYHYTPYPLIKTEVGKENKIILKIFDDGGTQNISHVGLAFGLGKGQSFGESKATINLDRTLFGKESISTIDPENVLDDVRVVTSKDLCNDFSTTQCLVVTIYQKFRDVLEFNIVATDVWDSNRNAWQNLYNHGIEITGDSMNPPKTKMVAFGEKNMRGLFELTQIDKKNHLWIDEFGNIYADKGNNRFDRISELAKEIKMDKLTAHGCDRSCNWFNDYKNQQTLLAESRLTEILDGQTITNESIPEPFSYSIKITTRAEDLELQKTIILEQMRALKILKESLHP